MYRNFIKRGIDIILSVLGISILILVWLIISLAIVINVPGPIIFRQKQIGCDLKDGQKQFFIDIKPLTTTTVAV